MEREIHGIVADILRKSPDRPKHGARTWARHQMADIVRTILMNGVGQPGKKERLDRAQERAAEWLNEHGDDTPPADFIPTWQF